MIIFGVLLIYGSVSIDNRGDADAVYNREKSLAGSEGAASYYVRKPYETNHTDNMVTVILADYRGFDTLGEETVIFTAGLICILLLRNPGAKSKGTADKPEKQKRKKKE